MIGGPAWMLIVGALFGSVNAISFGFYSQPAALVVLGALLTTMACWTSQLACDLPPDPRPRFVPMLWATLVAMAWYSLTDNELLVYADKPFEWGRWGQLGTVVLLLTYLPVLGSGRVEGQGTRALRFALLAVMLAVTACDVIHTSPHPRIDAWTTQQAGAKALLDGKNPYVEVAVPDTGPAARFIAPYIYPPTQLYITAPVFALTGDVRFAMLLAILASGYLLRFVVRRSAYSFSSIVEDAPALLLWTMPKLMFLIEQSWVDPVQLMLICLAAASVTTGNRTMIAVAFGVVLTAKQTMFWTVGIAGVLLGFNLRQWILVGAIGAAAVLPFAIADFPRLKYCLLGLVSALPDRPNAMTLNTWGLQTFGWMLPSAFAFPMAAAVAAVSAWRLPRTPWHWALATVATYAVFFVFNKWAFANYYFLLSGLASLAAALAAHLPLQELEETQSRNARRIPSTSG